MDYVRANCERTGRGRLSGAGRGQHPRMACLRRSLEPGRAAGREIFGEGSVRRTAVEEGVVGGREMGRIVLIECNDDTMELVYCTEG